MKKKLAILLISILLFYPKNFAIAQEEVLATFNENKITVSEFDLASQRPVKGKIPVSKREKEQFLKTIIASSLIAQNAIKMGMNEDPIIKQKVKKSKEFLLEYFLRKRITNGIIVPPYEWKKVRFREIVISKRSEAEEIVQAIMNGADFEILARERSINKYSKDGGDTGFIIKGEGTFLEQVEDFIFRLRLGECSEILKTDEGYAIFKAIETKDITDEERKRITEILQYKLNKEKIETFLEDLRFKAKIEIFSDNIEKIQGLTSLDDDPLQINLARVNNITIKLADVLLTNSYQTLFDPLKAYLLRAPSNLNNMVGRKIDNVLMINEAMRIGIDKDPEFQNLSKRFEEGFLAFNYITEVLLKDVTCTDEEAEKFYKEHKNSPEYKNLPETIRYRVILLDNKNVAEQILQRLKNGADFAEMARNYSMHASSSVLGGDLGYHRYGKDKISKEKFLFRLSEGEFSEVIESKPVMVRQCAQATPVSKFYKIFKVEDKIKAGANHYDELKDMIRKELIDKKTEREIKNLIDQSLKQIDFKINSNLL